MPSSRFVRRLAALSLAAVALPAAAQAPPVVLTPGSPELVAAPLQSFDYVARLADEVPRVLGHVSYTETREGDDLVMVTRRTSMGGGPDRIDTTVVAWPSLAPRRHATDDGEEASRVTIADGRIRGRSVLGNLNEALDAPLPAGAFGEGVAARLARSLPFADGYTATFRVADKRGDVETDTVAVTGPEPFVRSDGSATTAWLVAVASPGDPTRTYFVDTETREVLRVAFPAGRGMTVEFVAPPPPPSGPVLRPGDPALVTGWLSAADASTFTIRVVEPMQMDAGTSTTRRSVAGGVVTVETTISVPMQQMEVTTVSSADAATLAPRAHTSTGGPQSVEVAFTASGATGTETTDDAAEPIEVAFEAPVFDGAMVGELAQSLPFTDGYTATAQAYEPTMGLHAITFRVSGPTEVGGATAWTVEAASPAGPVTYVIDAATRHLLSMRMSPQPGVVVEMTRP